MQNMDVFVVVVIILCVTLALEYVSLSRKKFKRELQACLETQRSLPAFREMLESTRGRRCVGKKDAGFLLLDAAISLEDEQTARSLFRKLDEVRMNRTEFINYNMKKLAYGIQIQDPDLAQQGWKCIHDSRFARYVKREADQLYDIYVLHQANHIEELETFAEKAKNPSSKAMAYYRIARQYDSLSDKKNCMAYIARAREVYTDPTWRDMMDGILKGTCTVDGSPV